MNNGIGLTVKHCHEDGTITYLGAVSVQIMNPSGRPQCLMIECGDDDGRREVHSGRAYIMNAQGKTIDVVNLDSIAPGPDGPNQQYTVQQTPEGHH